MHALTSLGLDFHPAVRAWFERRFPLGPTEPQTAGWPEIARGRDVLIAAPTGSGKTLAAFLVCIDRLLRQAASGALEERVDVVYVSPLKALAADIHQNLELPLAEIEAEARTQGLAPAPIRALLRTGDTSASARAAMLKRPPHILVTTPESLYLLVTAERSRALLRGVRTVIVDEIHAVAGSKRGAHLALSLERLSALCDAPPARIGLSATQRPIETVAELLCGAERATGCAIVDFGHRRDLDLALEIPPSELAAVTSGEQWGEILDRISELVREHRTTLVFVNTRRLAERLAHLLAERLGEDAVSAHHGSLSKERRLSVEHKLRAGELRALVATASLELGIDIGPVELVCQIGSPRSLATFLQRVGRSGHARGATPKGRLFPTTRDELVECAALLRAVRAGKLDRLQPPHAPLDILAQQLVAACASEPWKEDDLYALVRLAAPYRDLARADFDAIVELLADGIQTGRGRRGAWLHRDVVNGMLRARRGARIAALTSGGAIPETADYRVVADPDDTFVGTVNEDWAIESMAGDIFLLGSTSWRIRRVEAGIVRVVDAGGAPPTVPFWLGEAPARTEELSAEVSALRAELDERLAADGVEAATAWLEAEVPLPRGAAEQLARYLEAARQALALLPTQTDVVFERFFDETGGMQLVLHAPFGGRINRGLGLALRKRFCRSFDFELQAAASDDAVVLSLGPQHSFPLASLAKFLSAESVHDVLAQALLLSPMFQARWRWTLGFALAVLRWRGGRKNPAPIQRMEADDLMAAVFPKLAQCQENATGPIEIPDHPLVRQVMHDCLHDATDVHGLERVLAAMASGAVRVHVRETTEPSVLCHEILNGRPFTFLDDAPLEERRTRAVTLRRGLPESERDLGRLDADAVARVRDEARPAPRDADELHDALLGLVLARPEDAWRGDFEKLVGAGRALVVEVGDARLWLAVESRRAVAALFARAHFTPDAPLPPALAARPRTSPEEAALRVLRGHLDVSGPVTSGELAERTSLAPAAVEIALAGLEAEGFALRGRFDPARAGGAEEWCARRLLARIHAYTHERLRREIEPVTAQDLMRFLLRWQHVAPGAQREGRRGLLAVVEQLQGFEVAAGSWEESVLPARVEGYRPEWLDALALSGEVAWARLTPRVPAEGEEPSRGGGAPSRSTPLALALREDLGWLLAAARGDAAPAAPAPGPAHDVLECLLRRGALFQREVVAHTRRLPIEVEEGLWELVARGLVTADGFQSVRALLGARERWAKGRLAARRGRAHARGVSRGLAAEGRWALLPPADVDRAPDELAEATARQLLLRWGVVFRDLVARETLALPWRDVLWSLRRLEARGEIRGGRFVTGFTGEQYALPEALDGLRAARKLERTGEVVRVAAVDPLNLVGVVVPGARVPAVRTRRVAYRDGAALAEAEAPPERRAGGAREEWR
jgi:ATP-dependent Lhr-like helicase